MAAGTFDSHSMGGVGRVWIWNYWAKEINPGVGSNNCHKTRYIHRTPKSESADRWVSNYISGAISVNLCNYRDVVIPSQYCHVAENVPTLAHRQSFKQINTWRKGWQESPISCWHNLLPSNSLSTQVSNSIPRNPYSQILRHRNAGRVCCMFGTD